MRLEGGFACGKSKRGGNTSAADLFKYGTISYNGLESMGGENAENDDMVAISGS